ncbi:unnamed protein product [Brassicogethes aeneus]|uniref:Structure-specific endonuclease subunit SLX4 n=1 Tax=Brassicogethes aeneus TaxID=1431903 RepID=A0A9P0BI25_BRAAE|nr:unnamed protein product [Brassicogethes aeneus]
MTENIKPPKIKDIVEISVGDTSDLDVAKILEKSQEILESISFEIKDTFEEIKDTKFDNKSTKMTFDSEIVNKDIKDSQIKVIDTYDLTLSSDDDDNFGIKGTSDEIKDTDSKIEILKDIEEKIKETDREIKDSHIYNLTPKKNSFCFDIKDTETKIKDNNYIHTISSDDEDLDSHISQKHDESLNKTKKLLEKSLNRSSISKSSASTSSNSINISKDLNYSSQSGITHYNSYSDRKISRYSFTYEDDDEQNMEKIKDICTQRSYDIVRDDSLGYNCTKSLNVTEYVTQMLNGEKKIETVSDSDDVEENSQCSSQTSFVSDEELNYSCHYATPVARRSLEQMDFVDNFCDYEPSLSPKNNISPKGTLLDNEKNRAEEIFNNTLDSTAVLNKVLDLEQEKVDSNVKTPSNYIIKKRDITPMPYYDEMDTPKIKKELDKFGLKPLKRQRGINLLKHIYDSTHPIVKHKSFEIDQELPICKKRRLSEAKTGYTAVIGECPNLCENIDDLIFERKFRAKIPSCRIPLQIVWHNFLHNHPDIFENILLYEPLQLEVIHKMLKELGYKFHIDDLLSFLDKKCITIRTAQGNQQKKK